MSKKGLLREGGCVRGADVSARGVPPERWQAAGWAKRRPAAVVQRGNVQVLASMTSTATQLTALLQQTMRGGLQAASATAAAAVVTHRLGLLAEPAAARGATTS